jgi:hypothetical protein
MLRKIHLMKPNFASVLFAISIFWGDFLVELSRQAHIFNQCLLLSKIH